MASNSEKLSAIKLAYQVLTDKRNMSKYAFTSLYNGKSGEQFTYDMMLDTLVEMAQELRAAAKMDGGLP